MLFAKEILNLDGYNFNYEKKEELRISEYSFLLDDKEYKEDFFQKTLKVSMDDGTKNRYLDENGDTVLRVLQRIPTFDSSDRMYNSYRMIFIIENNGKTEGIYLHGGYDLADAARYTGLSCADDKTKEMIEELRNANGNEKI